MGAGDGNPGQLPRQVPRSAKIYHLIGPEAAAELLLGAPFAGTLHQDFLNLAQQAGVGRQGEFILEGLQAGQALRLDCLRHLVREVRGPGFGAGGRT